MDGNEESFIAIIGMTGRFPDANTLERFWSNLRDGVNSVHAITAEELRQAGVDEATINADDYRKFAAVLTDFDRFDANFFGISPREAEIMDPQHRLFLECSWEALEHAGYSPRTYAGAIGVFAGTADSEYLYENILSNPRLIESLGSRSVRMANQKDLLCGRVAYELNLRGPAVVVLTACSTSLVAVHVACQSVLNGECDMALAGGVALHNLRKLGYPYVEGGVNSTDGKCRAFDAGATGIVDGSGVGIVVLKKLADARRDGDTIHAVIRGSAINNDGAHKISFTAPSVERQAAVISEALAVADVTADTIAYVEAHGTGTILGDPIEFTALTQAFSATSSRRQFCALGSVKTNLGHLDTAAGVAGLIKTVLALGHGEIPPSLHFEHPNPHIKFDTSPFFVNATLSPWPESGFPWRAGVSSFGVGGTNAHVILEAAPAAEQSGPSRSVQLLLLSAKTPAALAATANNLAAFLEAHPETNLADVAYTLESGREPFRYRRSVTCADVGAAIKALRSAAAVAPSSPVAGKPPRVVFMIPGGGTQYVNMARELYDSEATFRAVVDECAALLLPILDLDVRTVLFPEPGQIEAAEALLKQPQLIVGALFSIEYALARQLEAWGVRPDALVGHSHGEYVAACLAGVFSLADALTIVIARARLIGTMPAANMVAVLLPAEEVQSRLGDGVWLACSNSRRSCTVAGTQGATNRLAERLTAEGVEFQLLQGWPGSHSGLMEPILEPFRRVFENVHLSPPQLPYLSNLTGDWITPEQATDPGYWVAHLRNTVRFSDCTGRLLASPGHLFVEVGPGRTLSNLLTRDVPAGQSVLAIPTLPRRDAEGSSLTSVLQGLGQLWAGGGAIDVDALHRGERRHRIPLPTYPFERKRYWITPGAALHASRTSHEAQEADTQTAQSPELTASGGAVAGSSLYGRPALETPFVAPQSRIEQSLCEIWESILGVTPIGVNDNFFLLGGSSLIAIQLVSRIRTNFNVEIPLKTLFRESCVAAQAREIERALSETRESGEPPIKPRGSDAPPPPSFAQERLLFIDQLDKAEGAAYAFSHAIRIGGPLRKDVLRAALDRLVERHESLRTHFASVAGQAVQMIGAVDSGFALRENDLSQLSEEDRKQEVVRIGAAEGKTRFDLSAGPLIRGQLLRLGEEEHVLLITQHHIISDGWSIGIMIREVCELYAAFSQGLPDPLSALEIQYADYAIWQREWLQGEVLRQQGQYWKEQLSGAPSLLTLPTDRPRPAMQSYAGARVRFGVSKELTEGLRALSQRHGTTLFMTLLAGWAVLLGRLSGQSEVVIGTPLANRRRVELEQLIGFFVNALALRVRLIGNPTVSELLGQVKTTTLEAYEHQDLPFEQVVEMLQPVRSMSHTPVFQTVLNLHNTPGDSTLNMSGLTFDYSAVTEETATQCDIVLGLQMNGDHIVGSLTYASDLFDTETMERLGSYLVNVLGGMVTGEDQRVSQLQLMSEAQRRQVLYEFNDTVAAYPQQRLLHELFEAQVGERPGAVAVVYEGEELSYEELNRRANRLAHHLLARGLKPDDRVGICLGRGAGLVWSILGILKAGGAYVPLDPTYPEQRLAYMLRDSSPVALVTEASLAGRLAEAGIPLVVLDAPGDAAVLAGTADNNPDATNLGLRPQHLAYVIYTSGSTGAPKGVMVEHRGLCNLALAQIRGFAVEPDSRVLQFASLSFDACVSELGMTLCRGACLYMAPPGTLLAGEALIQIVRRYGITHVTLPPAVLAALPQGSDLESVRQLIVAGDAVTEALVRRWTQGRRLINGYGPTEVTVCASMHECDGEADGAPPIGRPIGNMRIYILDEHRQPVPIGVTGELYIGGVGVARGYLNRPGLTAERFLQDPFSPDGSGRMYQTGDLGRHRADGNIDFLGRNDFQVKIRGLRIELGEIEARLMECAGVREAAVLAREDSPGEKRLVGYVMGEPSQIQVETLRAQLGVLLPEYMVPNAYVVLESFPLTSNGKLDRNALPAPNQSSMATRQYDPPRGNNEIAIAGIWQELLGLRQISRHDDFFELGGHSLMGTRLMDRIRDLCHVSAALKDLFENPVLSALAARITVLQFESFVGGEDLEKMRTELAGLSESELLTLLSEETPTEERVASGR